MATYELHQCRLARPGFTFQPEVAVATPEPESLVLLGTGMLGLFGVVRRKLLY